MHTSLSPTEWVMEKALLQNFLASPHETLTNYCQTLEQKPFICISQEPGCAGLQVARIVAGVLGMRLLDKSRIHDLALTLATYRPAHEKHIDGKHEPLNLFLKSMLDPSLNEACSKLNLQNVADAIRLASCTESNVYLGRYAGFILPKSGLRIRLTASRELRLKQVQAAYNLNDLDTQKMLEELEIKQSGLAWCCFGADIGNINNYDLNIDLSNGDAMGAAKHIIHAALKGQFASQLAVSH